VHKAVIGETENKDYELTIADLDENPIRLGTTNGILHGGVPFECSEDWNTKTYILDLKGTFRYARINMGEPQWFYLAGTKLLVPYLSALYGPGWTQGDTGPVAANCTYHYEPKLIGDLDWEPGILLSRNQNWQEWPGYAGFPLTYWDLQIKAIALTTTPNPWNNQWLYNYSSGFGAGPLFRFWRYAANPVGTYQFIARRGWTNPNSNSRGWAAPGYDRINRLTCRVNEA
jgi:hypothetical protein